MTDELEFDWGGCSPRNPNAPSATADAGSCAPDASLHVSQPNTTSSRPGLPESFPTGLRFRTADFFEAPGLAIKEAVDLGEALLDWRSARSFDVRTSSGELVCVVGEHGDSAISRHLNRFYRQMLDCMSIDGSLFLRLKFPLRFLARCDVLAWDEVGWLFPRGFHQR
jgi:hypothetical protein